MNFPGVIADDEHELGKLELARHVDGHAPGVLGHRYQRLCGRGHPLGPRGVHGRGGRTAPARRASWCSSAASVARNLHALLPLVRGARAGPLAFCTDDREPEHIADDGHINSIVREAVAWGIAPEDALVASHHPALWHGLDHLGAVAPVPGRSPAPARPGGVPAGRRAERAPWPRYRRQTCRSGSRTRCASAPSA